MRIVVTGAAGLLGHHVSVRLHARNRAAVYRGAPEPFDLVRLGHRDFADAQALDAALTGAGAVIHCAGVNRGEPEQVEAANPAIARQLHDACQRVGARPHVVYANTIHAESDTPYGRGKVRARDILGGIGGGFSDLVLPHLFGEGARPNYNSVVATLIAALHAGETPDINPAGRLRLLHAGDAADLAINAATAAEDRTISPTGRPMTVPELWDHLAGFHQSDRAGVFPDLSDPFDAALFQSCRHPGYPQDWPRVLPLYSDNRGTLFEAAKGGGGGQSFVSTTAPGIIRGEHFHLSRVERFLVLQGEATIRLRPVFGTDIIAYRVSGRKPAAVDMPSLYTHSIENTGDGDLLTLFWSHDIFDPAAPDTYAERVLQCAA